MIAYLKGELVRREADRVIIDVGGVGYEAFCSAYALGKLPEAGSAVGLHTYLHVREEAMQLFGFSGEEEKALFLRLIGVSGVGPKLAQGIQSVFSPAELNRILIAGDVKALTSVSGVGQKGAKRLVLELQEKLVPSGEAGLPADVRAEAKSVFAEAREALVGLGYSPAEANRALEGFPEDAEATVEKIITYALKNLASV
jgi:holliday junction DNA helicase RuvA